MDIWDIVEEIVVVEVADVGPELQGEEGKGDKLIWVQIVWEGIALVKRWGRSQPPLDLSGLKTQVLDDASEDQQYVDSRSFLLLLAMRYKNRKPFRVPKQILLLKENQSVININYKTQSLDK